jgi:hypothetical protein
VYSRLKVLNALRHEICPSASAPYSLVIDALNAETMVFFSPTYSALAIAFAAMPCSPPETDGHQYVDLEYCPLPVTVLSSEIFQPVHARSMSAMPASRI